MMARKAMTISDMSVGVGGNRKGRGACPPDGVVRKRRVVNGPVLRSIGSHGAYRIVEIRVRGKPELRYLRTDSEVPCAD
jgi:hypothetical protein